MFGAVHGGVYGTVLAGFFYLLPVLLGLLGITALGRDRLAGAVLLAVAAGFAGHDALALLRPAAAPALPPGLWWLWPAAAAALVIRLRRDRARRHVRSLVESLAVLASGAILLATLLSLPAFLSAVARAGGG